MAAFYEMISKTLAKINVPYNINISTFLLYETILKVIFPTITPIYIELSTHSFSVYLSQYRPNDLEIELGEF